MTKGGVPPPPHLTEINGRNQPKTVIQNQWVRKQLGNYPIADCWRYLWFLHRNLTDVQSIERALLFIKTVNSRAASIALRFPARKGALGELTESGYLQLSIASRFERNRMLENTNQVFSKFLVKPLQKATVFRLLKNSIVPTIAISHFIKDDFVRSRPAAPQSRKSYLK